MNYLRQYFVIWILQFEMDGPQLKIHQSQKGKLLTVEKRWTYIFQKKKKDFLRLLDDLDEIHCISLKFWCWYESLTHRSMLVRTSHAQFYMYHCCTVNLVFPSCKVSLFYYYMGKLMFVCLVTLPAGSIQHVIWNHETEDTNLGMPFLLSSFFGRWCSGFF
jgi:hypothetical protein